MKVPLTHNTIAACVAADREGVFNDAWVKQKWGVTIAQRDAFMRVQLAVCGFGDSPLSVKEVKDLVAGKKVRMCRLSDQEITGLKEVFHV